MFWICSIFSVMVQWLLRKCRQYRLPYVVISISLIYTTAAVFNVLVKFDGIVSTIRTNRPLTKGTERSERSNIIDPSRPQNRNRTLVLNQPLTLQLPYLLNSPDVCTTAKNLSYVIIVHTAITHREHRLLIRRTWANNTLLPFGRIVFLFGISMNVDEMLAITEEHRVFGDIVQGNF